MTRVSINVSDIVSRFSPGAARRVDPPVMSAPSPAREALNSCVRYREAFPSQRVCFPAAALRNSFIAQWVRDHDVTIEVRSSEDLRSALAAGVYPARLIVHADGLSTTELISCSTHLAVGMTVVGSADHVAAVSRARPARHPELLLHVFDDDVADATARPAFRGGSSALDEAIASILDNGLALRGMHCEIGSYCGSFVSTPAAIGDLITEFARVRAVFGTCMTVLGLSGPALSANEWVTESSEQAKTVDTAVDDACAAVDFPRPAVWMSAGLTASKRWAS
ncbi:hypothetical protein [Mycolicibacterium iranicum]|uniref:hypothetical protein n=1 Tax=Mycolicibacterium iranicum TaxID=912594 RepID=UPI000A92B84B|nr:hypothetical protein [Mycolicibacterium iranicum]